MPPLSPPSSGASPPSCPPLTLDGLLRHAARRNGAATAIGSGSAALTFAELDARADRFAHWLERTHGRRGARVAVATTLDPLFAAAYYGVARSGNTVVVVNPFLGEAALRHVCAAAGVETALVPGDMAEKLVKLRPQLPRLHRIVVTDAEDGIVPADAQPLQVALAAAASADEEPEGRELSANDPETLAVIQFTSGTTGRAKGVRLTHRNLAVNAAQTAAAHRLDQASVALNHLPLFHPMHLNATVHAGAEHLLCQDEDPFASLARAAEAGATHYYGLPARLHRLARDPRLDLPGGVPALPALTAVLSGGAALVPAAAARLRAALRVPVIQGYGLAELSPLSHTQRPDAPCAHDCVGRPVRATQCRIVHLDTRRPLPPGEAGEVQLRGPQLMAGYLGEAGRSGRVDADGWFSTGDVGFEDQDGCLHLVDRLGDVFKHDNDLVSPTAVERVLGADPRVAECVVADWPDPDHGAVVWAGVVLHRQSDAPPARPDSVLDLLDAVVSEANAQLTPHERIRRVEALDAVPRTPTGKPARAAVRARLHAEAAAEHAATPSAA